MVQSNAHLKFDEEDYFFLNLEIWYTEHGGYPDNTSHYLLGQQSKYSQKKVIQHLEHQFTILITHVCTPYTVLTTQINRDDELQQYHGLLVAECVDGTGQI